MSTKKHLGNEIEWVDISSSSDFVNDTNKEKDELYRRMHIIDDGELITGAKTFLIIWKKFRGINTYVNYFQIQLFFLFLIYFMK